MTFKQIISAHRVFLLIGVVVFFSSRASAAQTLTVTSVGKYDFTGSEPTGLSGLTYAGGNQYYAVEDSDAKLHPMTIQVNSSTGAVASASFQTHITLSGSDLEGVAYNSAAGTVYVSDEHSKSIKEYNLSGGLVSSVSMPVVYGSCRANYGLESLSRRAGGLSLWTANEESLYDGLAIIDGPLSTTASGTVVRLQRFNSILAAVGQWAYVTEPITSMSPYTTAERSGVSDLCVLPNGKVLVLERELNGEGFMGLPQFTNRIYEIDFASATDVSGINSLEGATYTLVTKHLLWTGVFGFANFEGLALGPELDNGDYSLLMISDGDSGLDKSLYALQLSGDVPEPTTLALLMCGGCAALIKRRKR